MSAQDPYDTDAPEQTEADAWDDPAYGDHPQGDPSFDDDEPAMYGEGVDDPVRHSNPRRTQATVLMIVASGFFLLSLVVLAAYTVGSGGFRDALDFLSFRVWIFLFCLIMLVLFIWLLVLLLTTPPREEDDWFADDEDEIPVAEPGRAGDPDTITLRCPECVTVFSLQDPMTRPFYHDCPTCRVRGVYTGRDDPPEVVAKLEEQNHEHGAHA